MRPSLRAAIAYAAALAVLLGVFALYTRPDLMIALSEQIWACFGK
jgi:hypothetical protein